MRIEGAGFLKSSSRAEGTCPLGGAGVRSLQVECLSRVPDGKSAALTHLEALRGRLMAGFAKRFGPEVAIFPLLTTSIGLREESFAP